MFNDIRKFSFCTKLCYNIRKKWLLSLLPKILVDLTGLFKFSVLVIKFWNAPPYCALHRNTVYTFKCHLFRLVFEIEKQEMFISFGFSPS